MKNILLPLLAFCFLSVQAIAQKATRHYPGKIKYNKIEHDATIFDVPYPAGQVEDGLRGMLKDMGIKVKEKNGFFEAPNVKFQQLGDKPLDIYYKVVKDGKDNAKVYTILMEPGQSPDGEHKALGAATISAGIGAAGILAVIAPALDEQDFNIIKNKKEDEIKKTEKKLNDLIDDQSKMEKKRADLEKEIEKIKQDQVNLQAELDKKKSSLTDFINKAGKGKKD